MKQIHPVFCLWDPFFPIFLVNKHPQDILEFFKLTVSGPSSKNAAPQSIDFDALTQAQNSIIPLVELKDGKKQALAAPIGKKESRYMHCMELSEENKKSTHLYAIIQKNNHQSIIINNNLYENFE